MTFEPGQILGEYKVVRKLGHGGLGAVYQAVHLISQRSEALKVLLPEQAGDDSSEEMAERFRREIQMLASLNHPNIAALHHAFYLDHQLIMAMELVEGEDLKARSRRDRIPMPLLMEFATQTLQALDYAHAHGVIHRDIKPANLMVDASGRLKVLDFGIAVSSSSTDLTLAGTIIGSPMHMSPEQVRGEKATAASDIYSLGVTLYELIAGQPPLRGQNANAQMMAHLNQVPVPLAEVRPDIPIPLSNMVAKALAKQPSARFATASQFLEAIRSLEVDDATMTAPISAIAGWQRVATDELSVPSSATQSPPLEALTRSLAVFIGPIAKIVVKRLAAKYSDLDRLYLEAAKEIDDENERKKFLRTRPLRSASPR